ncbi:caspase family protein [Dactylosporangium sp. NPDC049525]|uniref:caspase, EACC1-associated type n=1 Tax=Dactylosporangium sp. NPDC049525 TaxID=3154730 RepID=UPI00343195CC
MLRDTPSVALSEPSRLGAYTGIRVLLVGTGTHAAESDLPDVPAVATTLTDLRQAFIDRCGVPVEAISVTCDPQSTEQFGNAVADVAEKATDLLLIYYVGHGLVADDGTLHMATSRSVQVGQRVRFTALPFATIRACVADSPALTCVVILDCCYAGRAMPVLGAGAAQVTDLTRIAGAMVLTAAGRNEHALAPVGQRHTAFTGALLQLLAAGDPELPDVLTFDDVFRHLERVLPSAGLPRPRRLVDGQVGTLAVAPNPTPRRDTVPTVRTGAGRAGRDEAVEQCPYLGLAAFGTADEPLFFGRSRLVREALERLSGCLSAGAPLVMLGASGAGKSSVLRAGVLPALGRGDLGEAGSAWWPRRLFTPTDDPVGELSRVIGELSGRATDDVADIIRRSPDHLPELLHDRGWDRAVLVVDQFEELFAPTVPAASQRVFVQALLAAAADKALVVFGVRADFYDRCMELPGLDKALERYTLVVRAMTRDETHQAIAGPAAAAQLDVEPGLFEVLLADLGANTGTDQAGETPGPEGADHGVYEPGRLPLLSHALRMTWHERDAEPMSVAAYGRTGGIHGALATTADEVLSGLDDAGRDCARQLFLRLVRITEETAPTRRRVDRDRLLADLPDPTLGRTVLDAFAGDRARLVTVDQGSAAITHEALLRGWPVLRGWIEQDRAGLAVEQQLIDDAHTWAAGGQDTDLLYRGGRLAGAAGWAADQDHHRQLPATATLFLTASRRQHTRRRRLRTGLVAVLSTLLVVTLAGAAVAWQQRRYAVTQQRNAVAGSLMFVADSLLNRDPVTAVRLAVSAASLSPDVGVRTRLVDLLARSRFTGVFAGHRDGMLDAELSPDGRVLGLKDEAGRLTWWLTGDASHPVPLFTLSGSSLSDGEDIDRMSLTADGRTLATVGKTGLRLWDVTDPADPRLLGPPIGAAAGAPRFSLHDNRLAVTAADKATTLWDVSDLARPARVATLAGRTDDMHTMVWSPDGRMLATAGKDGHVRLWDADGRQLADVPAAPLDAPSDGGEWQQDINTMVFSPDGRFLATGGNDRRVRLWSVVGSTLTLASTLTDHTLEVYSLAFSPDGSALATAGGDRAAILWDVTDMARPLRSAALSGDIDVDALAFSPDGRALLTAGDGTVLRWTVDDPTQPASPRRLQGHKDGITGIAFSPDSSTVASSSWDWTARLWDVAQAAPLATLAEHTEDVFAVAFSPDGGTLVTAGDDGKARLWRVTDPEHVGPSIATRQLPDSGTGVSFGPAGQHTLAISTLYSGPMLWDVADPRTPALLDESAAETDSGGFGLAYSSDGKRLATISVSRTDVWNVNGRHLTHVQTLTDQADAVIGVAFSPDGRTLATAGRDNTARVWTLRDNGRFALAATILGHDNVVGDVAFSRDGNTLATAGFDRAVLLWNVTDPARPIQLASLRGHSDFVQALSFSPDRRTLASGSQNGTLLLWDVGRLLELSADPTAYACAIAGAPTREQWLRYVPGITYRNPCSP